MLHTATRVECRPSHTMSLLIPSSPHIFFVCSILAYLRLAEGKDPPSPPKKTTKCKVCEPLFTFSKMVHMSASLRNGWGVGECFYICHSSINTHQPRVFPSLPPSLPPSISLPFALPLWFLLSLSLNVR